MPLRSYDPTIARWNRIDPVTHFSLSTYNGFDNNPIYYADPSGGNSFRGGHANRLQRMRDNYFGSEYSNIDGFMGRVNDHSTTFDDNNNRPGVVYQATNYGNDLIGALNDLGARYSIIATGNPTIEGNDGDCSDCSRCPELCGQSGRSESQYKVTVNSDQVMEEAIAAGVLISKVDGAFKLADIVGGAYILNSLLALAVAHQIAGIANDTQDAILLQYDKNWLYAKQNKELNKLLVRSGGSPGMTYALLVNTTGDYVDVRGNLVHLKAGDVWKYGKTTLGIDGRYPGNKLETMIPGGVTPRPLFFGTNIEMEFLPFLGQI